jgi:hypothetical protein
VKQHAAARSSLEALEARIAPAALVDFTLGKLTVTGDAVADYINIFPTGPGTFRVDGGSIQVGGGNVEPYHDFVGTIKGIEILAGSTSSPTPNTFIISDLKFASLKFTGGPDGDNLELHSVNIKGDVDIDMKATFVPQGGAGPGNTQTVTLSGDSVLIGGKLSVQASGVALDTFPIPQINPSGLILDAPALSTTILGSLSFTGTPNPDRVSLGNVLSGGVVPNLVKLGKEATFTGTEDIQMNARNLSLGRNALGQSLIDTGSAVRDILRLTGNLSLTVAGSIDFMGGGGNDLVSLSGGHTKIGKSVAGPSLNIAQSVDASSVSVSASGVYGLSLAGYATVTDPGMGAGVSLGLSSNGGAVTVGKSATGRSIDLAGSGVDSFSVSGLSVSLPGGVVYDGAANTSFVMTASARLGLSIGKTSTGQSVAIASGGKTDLKLTGLGTTKLTGSVEVAGGNGRTAVAFGGALNTENSDSVMVGKNAAGKSVVVTAAGSLGATSVSLFGTTSNFAGSVESSGGTLPSLLFVNTGKLMLGKDTTGRSLSFTGTDGDDLFEFLSPNVNIAGSVNFNGGAGLDTVHLRGNGTIRGDVMLDLGSSVAAPPPPPFPPPPPPFPPVPVTIQEIAITTLRAGAALKIAGHLGVQSGSTDVPDHLTLNGVDLAQAVTVVLGDFDDVVQLDNIVARTSLAVNTGAGDDVLNVETDHTFGSSAIKAASVLLGTGNDHCTIGSADAASDKVVWSGLCTIDGGDQTSADVKSVNPASATGVTFSGFE